LVAGLKCQSRRGATRQSQRDTKRGRGVNAVKQFRIGQLGKMVVEEMDSRSRVSSQANFVCADLPPPKGKHRLCCSP
jgi:hypothetical protein